MCSVVCVKGIALWMSVMRPPPPALCLSLLRVVYPGNFGVSEVSLSLVSWMAAMCMLCVLSMCLSSMCLF